MSDTFEYAKLYIAKGWFVFPVDGKVPLTKNGLKDASNLLHDIELWWGPGGKLKNAGIGIRTGDISGLVVADIDAKSGGLESYQKMIAKFPVTPKVATGGGGYHLYYAHPGGEIKNSASKIAPGIDIRGDNGYVVAPPSLHASGKQYEWEILPSQTPLAAFPMDVLPKETTFNPSDLHTQGKRNSSTTQLVGHLKRLGLPDDATLAAIMSIDNGLPDAEKMAIVQHSKNWAGSLPPRTEIGQAELITSMYSDHVCYDKRQKSWLTWDTQHWKLTTSVYPYVKETARWLGQKAIDMGNAVPPPNPQQIKESEDLAKWAMRLESSAAVSAVTTLLEQESGRDTELDAQPYLLGVKNGVVNLADGSLLAGVPSQWITRTTSLDYVPTATCPAWEKFCMEIFRDRDGKDRPDLVDWVHRAVGYSATGDVSRQCWFLCLGGGSNGKGTFLGLIKDVLGEYGQKLSVKTITVRSSRRSTDDDMANLAGARFLLCGEAGVSAELDSERIKELVGADTAVRASRIYQGEIEFIMHGKIWMPNNRHPRSNDDSYGFWRRAYLIPFDQIFAIDPTLRPKLEAEAEGILAWIVRGAIEYVQRGLEPPLIVQTRTKDWQESNDPLVNWYREGLTVDKTGTLKDKDVYPSYIGWCSTNDVGERERVGRRRVNDYIEAKHSKKRANGITVYEGVRLHDDAIDNQTGGAAETNTVPVQGQELVAVGENA